jgi:hypothetical protein
LKVALLEPLQPLLTELLPLLVPLLPALLLPLPCLLLPLLTEMPPLMEPPLRMELMRLLPLLTVYLRLCLRK